MVAKIMSAVPRGVEALPVQVEVDARPGLPMLSVVGPPRRRRARGPRAGPDGDPPPRLPARDQAASSSTSPPPRSARRARSSTSRSPPACWSPASSSRTDRWATLWMLGELSLDGTLAPGARRAARSSRRPPRPVPRCCCPHDNLAEAAVVRGARLLPAGSLAEVVAHLRGERALATVGGGDGCAAAVRPMCMPGPRRRGGPGAGQARARDRRGRGPPPALPRPAGRGQDDARAAPPGDPAAASTRREALATTKVYSVAPGVPRPDGLILGRARSAPRTTPSRPPGWSAAGSLPRPGEISLAHNGVLFLDEITEFRRDVLEVLRQPLESGRVVIARAAGTLTFPARFQLVAAANPCPCGHLGDPRRECRCTPLEVRRYRAQALGAAARPHRPAARGAGGRRSASCARPTGGEPPPRSRERVVAARGTQASASPTAAHDQRRAAPRRGAPRLRPRAPRASGSSSSPSAKLVALGARRAPRPQGRAHHRRPRAQTEHGRARAPRRGDRLPQPSTGAQPT